MLVLIDSDICVYRAGFSAQSTYYSATHLDSEEVCNFPTHMKKQEVIQSLISSGEDLKDWLIQPEIEVRPASHACQAAKRIVQQCLNRCKSNKYKLYLTSNDKSNYRFKVATLQPYKGNRVAAKPAHYDVIREYLINYWDAEVISGMEADDALGIEQCKRGLKSVICSIDKDMDQVPGWHYNFVSDRVYKTSDKDLLELYDRSGKKAIRGGGIRWFYAQMLLGDSADNIPGIPGYGAVRTAKLLNSAKDSKEMAKKVAEVYKMYYNKEAEKAFKEVSKLLWIKRK